jgi:Choline/Carnitine o-acyltransferase
MCRRVVKPLESTASLSLDGDNCLSVFLGDIDCFERGDDAVHLQAALVERFERTTNWFADWLAEYRFLSRRRSLQQVNGNYFVDDARRNERVASSLASPDRQLATGAAIMSAILQFHRHAVVDGAVPADVRVRCVNGVRVPVATDVYRSGMFGASRVPLRDADGDGSMRVGSSRCRHAVVASARGRYYRVQVIADDGEALSPRALRWQLQRVMALDGVNDEQRVPGGEAPPVSALTALMRHRWSEARSRLASFDTRNAGALDTIDSALFLIHLDASAPRTRDQVARAALTGGAHDRQRLWLDKPFQMLVFANGALAANVERSWCIDTSAFASAWQSMLDTCASIESMRSSDADVRREDVPRRFSRRGALDAPRLVRWALRASSSSGGGDSLMPLVAEAHASALSAAANIDIHCAQAPYGGTLIAQTMTRTSVGGIYQMALQLAYKRVHGVSVKTRVDASTRFFCRGAVEFVWVASVESAQFVDAMLDDESSRRDWRRSLLLAAVEEHRRRMLDASLGRGADGHLIGLRIVARGVGRISEIAMFARPDTPLLRPWRLATLESNVGGGVFPATEQGYGFWYSLADGRFTVTSMRADTSTDSRRLASAFCQALVDIQALF